MAGDCVIIDPCKFHPCWCFTSLHWGPWPWPWPGVLARHTNTLLLASKAQSSWWNGTLHCRCAVETDASLSVTMQIKHTNPSRIIQLLARTVTTCILISLSLSLSCNHTLTPNTNLGVSPADDKQTTDRSKNLLKVESVDVSRVCWELSNTTASQDGQHIVSFAAIEPLSLPTVATLALSLSVDILL